MAKIAIDARPGGPAAKRQPSPEGLGNRSQRGSERRRCATPCVTRSAPGFPVLTQRQSSGNRVLIREASDRFPCLLPSRPSCAESGAALSDSWYSTSLVSRRHTRRKSEVRFRKPLSSQCETAFGTDCPGFRRRRLRLHLYPPIGSRAQERSLRQLRRVVRRCPAQDYFVLGARGRPPIFRSQSHCYAGGRD